MNEKQVQKESVKLLRDAGWFVIVTAQDRAMRKQASGLPDALAFRNNVTLLIEFKGDGGKMQESQVLFWAAINEHTGPNLRYLVVAHPSVIDAWL